MRILCLVINVGMIWSPVDPLTKDQKRRPFYYFYMNKLPNKQLSWWWFEMPWCSLWLLSIVQFYHGLIPIKFICILQDYFTDAETILRLYYYQCKNRDEYAIIALIYPPESDIITTRKHSPTQSCVYLMGYLGWCGYNQLSRYRAIRNPSYTGTTLRMIRMLCTNCAPHWPLNFIYWWLRFTLWNCSQIIVTIYKSTLVLATSHKLCQYWPHSYVAIWRH